MMTIVRIDATTTTTMAPPYSSSLPIERKEKITKKKKGMRGIVKQTSITMRKSTRTYLPKRDRNAKDLRKMIEE